MVDVPEVIRRHAQAWATGEDGAVTQVTADAIALVEHGDAMFAAAPIRAIAIEDPDDAEWDVDGTAARMASCAWLPRVESVTVGLYRAFAEGDVLAVVLGAAPRLAELRVPHPTSVIGVAGLALPSLSSLFVYCESSDDGDQALAALAERERHLRQLQIVGCTITDEAARTIAAARWPLSYLAFGGTHYARDTLGEPGVHALATAEALADLQTLDLVATALDDAAVRTLAASRSLRALRQLGLAENRQLTAAGLASLAASPILATVRELALHGTSIDDDALATFATQHPGIAIAKHVFTRWGG